MIRRYIAPLLVLLAGLASAHAQGYPDKPLKLIVAYAPGGSNDAMARMLAAGLATELKQPVVVENRAGAAGNIGANAAAHSEPDGYTLFMVSSAHLANMALYKNPTYDIIKDFAPVTRLALNPNVLVVGADSPARDLAGLVAAVKASKTPLTYGSAGNGTGQHLAGVMFANRLGSDMTHIPYKGGAPAVTDLLAGRVDVLFSPYVEVKPFIDGKKMRALAVTTTTRFTLLPNVPAIAEIMPGFEITQWNGIMTRRGTPPERIALLNTAIRKVTDSPAIQQALLGQGIPTATNSPAEFQKLIDAEVPKWAEIVRLSGASAD